MGAFIDFTGKRFGSLTVISFSKISEKKRTYWNCKCDCGIEKEVWAGHIRNVKSCGKKDCLPLFSINMKTDLAGKTFHYLTVVKYEIRKHWACICICGKSCYVKTNDLTTNKVKSCGCKATEINAIHHILPNNAGFFNRLIAIYKAAAAKRSYSFELSMEEFIELTTGNCHYCNSPPSNTSIKRKFFSNFTYNGVDRKNNTMGYIAENVVSCCKTCNVAKSDMIYDDFISWLDLVAKFRKK